MDWREKIIELATTHLTHPAHFLVDVVLSKHKPMKVSVIIDGDHGITIDDCAQLSRALNESLEKLIADPYALEVTTPGLDHPLKLKRQYVKNTNRQVKIVCVDKRILTGQLTEVQEEKIVVETEHGQGKKMELKIIEIPFVEIEKTFIIVSFK